ncbi:MAG: thioredoxin family protein [Herpetosiphonaceae bacterium]|nr:thioredoxin family protein [Herpetosiphonaceae bacterium]
MDIIKRLALIISCLTFLSACGTTTASPTAASPTVQATLAASTLVVGANRLPIGLVVDGTPINEPGAKVLLRFFYLDGTDAEKSKVAGESAATYFGQGLPVAVYVTYPNFPRAGAWGVEVEATLPNQAPSISRLRLEVLASDPTPALGSPAIDVETPTAKTNPDLSTLTSDLQPNPALYQQSVDEALKSGKPTAILFATPGFCKTATCGPSVNVISGLQKTYGERMNFIHVEVYQYPFGESAMANPPRLAPAMGAWRLQSEPWLFLVGADGLIQYKYEGGITVEELTPVVEDMLKRS